MSAPTALDFAGLLGILNFTDNEFVSVLHWDGHNDKPFAAVGTPSRAPAYADKLPHSANVFFGVNPVGGPAREGKGRGKEADITRLSALTCDLDVKPGGCPNHKVALDIIADLSVLLGTRPSAIVESGHGVHAYWPIDDGQIGDGDISAARALLKRWGRLVVHAAEIHGVRADGVFDLARVLRLPGSYNNKGLNGEAPPLVTARLESGGPLTMAEVAERLDEAGVVERVDDRVTAAEQVSSPDGWTFADHTCGYVTKMINRWLTDRPEPGGARNPFVYNRYIRLFCALRNGCITADDYQRARRILEGLLTELVTTTEPRRDPRRFEIADMHKHGIVRAASHTDDQVRAELGDHNHPGDDKTLPDRVKPGDGQTKPGDSQASSTTAAAPTTWEPVDLGPWLNGTVVTPTPTLGITRSDGLRFLYPGREHAVLGETESGKTWFALGCVVPELLAGHSVTYIHYEEGDPGSTIERLQLLGVDSHAIATLLRFVAPDRPPRDGWVQALLDPAPTLVVHDGVNEAMALMGAEIKDVDGAALFRRRLVTPFLKVGAASVACDHLPMNPAPGRRDAYGSVHKGNALNGARIQLENTEPFGRQMRGVSHVYVTKDRPGYLRSRGRPTKIPGKTYMGTLVVDDMTCGPDFVMRVWAPKDSADTPTGNDPDSQLAETVWGVVDQQPEHAVSSKRALFALMRLARHKVAESKIRNAVDDLLAVGRLAEVPGRKGATGYKAVVSAAGRDPQ